MAAVVLAAGEGARLRPLTLDRPKALCPVGGRPLLDLALARVPAGIPAAVNVHHGRVKLEEHLAGRFPDVHVSIEEQQALGTAGALGHLRDWLDGRDALVVNADAWTDADLGSFVVGWDGERVSVLVVDGGRFGPGARIAGSIVPWSEIAALEATPSGLYERCWRPAHVAERLEVVTHRGLFVDCGTPTDYLAANLLAADRAGGSIVAPDARAPGVVDHSVVGAGAYVGGTIRDSVVWDEASVVDTEVLHSAIRATPRLTVLVRTTP